jgi:1,4-dihydroxy-2-naphthoate octaprenyltransferase
VSAFNNIWNSGLMLFGLHLLLLGYLAYKSGYVPKWLGILIAVAGFGYSFDSVASVLSLGLTTKIASVTFVGEVALILWLLIKGRHIKLSDELASAPN